MKSVGQKIKQCEGLIGTKDVTDWENGFLQGIVESTAQGENTANLSPRQVEVIDRIHGKHFA